MSFLPLEKPRYEHDCEKCVYIGKMNEYDLYYCKSKDETSYIARYSSEGSEYKSYADFKNKIYNGLDSMTNYGNFSEEEKDLWLRQKTSVLLLFCNGYTIFEHVIDKLKKENEYLMGVIKNECL